ncbi:hypothetical protein Moror_11992 [Moniliophthora roreri MCA 2997]|uniref:Uncharacterized protein n=1 Tax=Moniliophthora roreri (strain MCA 2997) TaxID=1381753 RepID=V2Y5S7_MONRO|nr:hypothetical protein Moror_11992 [Moniliophthora roreri MCA 2997]
MDVLIAAGRRRNERRLEDIQQRTEILVEYGSLQREPLRSEKLIIKTQTAAKYGVKNSDGLLGDLVNLMRSNMNISAAKSCLKTIEKRERLRARLEFLQKAARADATNPETQPPERRASESQTVVGRD